MRAGGVKVTRVCLTESGGSGFAEVDIPLVEEGPLGRLSEPLAADGVIFRESAAEDDLDWHNAPRRQLIVLLDGEIEVEVTSGEKRRFGGGDVVLVEDTTGTGHRTRNVGRAVRHSLFIPLT